MLAPVRGGLMPDRPELEGWTVCLGSEGSVGDKVPIDTFPAVTDLSSGLGLLSQYFWPRGLY